ncbi:MAG: hypothetical protein GWO39_08430, partial [Gammaproteobacteria bacterium]|nr:hypothetical protein [Gammaproteobacteria bacterium]NIY32379.1 hypothetical protein [Gammaproteobacteria bacterium]
AEAGIGGDALASLLEAHDRLLDMADAVAANQDLAAPPPQLLERLDALSGTVPAAGEPSRTATDAG